MSRQVYTGFIVPIELVGWIWFMILAIVFGIGMAIFHGIWAVLTWPVTWGTIALGIAVYLLYLAVVPATVRQSRRRIRHLRKEAARLAASPRAPALSTYGLAMGFETPMTRQAMYQKVLRELRSLGVSDIVEVPPMSSYEAARHYSRGGF